MKAIIVSASFPISELFAELDIYTLKKRQIGDKVIIELDNFDYLVLKTFMEKGGRDFGSIELQ